MSQLYHNDNNLTLLPKLDEIDQQIEQSSNNPNNEKEENGSDDLVHDNSILRDESDKSESKELSASCNDSVEELENSIRQRITKWNGDNNKSFENYDKSNAKQKRRRFSSQGPTGVKKTSIQNGRNRRISQPVFDSRGIYSVPDDETKRNRKEETESTVVENVTVSGVCLFCFS